jgi:hypothetical protein
MTTKTLTLEKPDIHIENWKQFEFSAIKLLYTRFKLNDDHVNQRIRNILTEHELRDLTVFLLGSDWAKSVSIIGNLRIVEG